MAQQNRAKATGRATYGFDAPSIMISMLAAGILSVGTGSAMALQLHGWLQLAGALLLALGLIPLALGFIMFTYGTIGKLRIRDFMIQSIPWQGNERVLDIGTGRGLLLIAAAKRLNNQGRATGIDIWRKEDLAGNSLDQLALNVEREDVEDRVSLKTEDARQMTFPNDSFDVIFSLYCIHNIDSESGQDQALREIVRVLKPGGRLQIGEYQPTHRYVKVLTAAGLTVNHSRTYFRIALGPMWMIDAYKPPLPNPPL